LFGDDEQDLRKRKRMKTKHTVKNVKVILSEEYQKFYHQEQ
jgi:hypothetical protein